jgi:eukaryotic-like serine/threonine-protein kinase
MNKIKQISLLLSINLILLGGLIYFFSNGIFSFLNLYTNYNKSVCMPNLGLMNVEEAKNKLKALHLRYDVDDSFYNPAYKPGEILNFAPAANEWVKENREVYLQVNGNGKVKLPALKGKEKKFALNAIFKADLNIKNIIYLPDKENQDKIIEILFEGKIINTQEELPHQSNLSLLIGKQEKEKILIPDLKGMELELANHILKKYDFTSGKIHYNEENVADEKNPFNSTLKIYKQFPDSGQIYHPNQPIELWVSQLNYKELEKLIDFHEKESKEKQEIDYNFDSIFNKDKDIIIQ